MRSSFSLSLFFSFLFLLLTSTSGDKSRAADDGFLQPPIGRSSQGKTLLVSSLYSLPGILLYALLCGYLPFDDDNITNLYRKIKAGRYVVPDCVSPESSQLIAQLLQVDPKRRITIGQLMEHPWLCKFDGKVTSEIE